ncbi:hypothetical protein ZIOFF_024180 [Zingiber officinale]|uniref:Gamma-soluble NSF attachment protein n=1 Tax=Zingiber officinale TaxID=94328 RepID=A0A8J5LIX5_ZINOF|nr:hypothetical protein ZIOFF_024180 [Zingiber officinale]
MASSSFFSASIRDGATEKVVQRKRSSHGDSRSRQAYGQGRQIRFHFVWFLDIDSSVLVNRYCVVDEIAFLDPYQGIRSYSEVSLGYWRLKLRSWKCNYLRCSTWFFFYCRTNLSFIRWNADWKNATALYEQDAVGYRFRKENEKAKEAFEKASKGQELISPPWDAAKHMESAASLAKELSRRNEVFDFYRKASELFRDCGRSQPASDALGKGASALEDTNPDEAVRLYIDACEILEEDGKEQMAFDLYRAVTSTYVKLER